MSGKPWSVRIAGLVSELIALLAIAWAFMVTAPEVIGRRPGFVACWLVVFAGTWAVQIGVVGGLRLWHAARDGGGV